MDKQSFSLLLGSIAASALVGCHHEEDPECPHTVVLAEADLEVDTARVCQGMAPLPERFGSEFGVSGAPCGALCGNANMNICRVHATYEAEFAKLNGADGRARQCPSWDATIPITCTQEEQRGVQHDGCAIAGRRPSGLLAVRRHARDAVADYLARAAHLEAASVFAFDKLAEDLARLGAPAELIDECLRAARDETEHAQIMGRLARRRGARPLGVDVMAHGNASALELALENVVEGVVREAYGALQASVSARKARDLGVRVAMAGIADDEAAHAWLALRVGEWLDGRLTAAEQARVREAKRAAMWALRQELEAEPEAVLRDEVGLPTRAEAIRLFVQLERSVWAGGIAA